MAKSADSAYSGRGGDDNDVSIVLRLLPYIAAVSLVVGVGWYTIDSAYEHGRKMERLEWMEHEEETTMTSALRKSNTKCALEREKQTGRFATQIIGRYAKLRNLTRS